MEINEKNGGPVIFKPIPGNNPEPIHDTLKIPYWYVGILRMTFPNGKNYYGTGTLIVENESQETSYVLTCAHNLYDKADGGRATAVSFEQAFSHVFAPFPVNQAVDFFYPENYPDVSIPRNANLNELGENLLMANINADYALVKLKNPVKLTDVSVAPVVKTKTTEELQDLLVQINGYGFYETTMSHATGTISEVTDYALRYGITTAQGASGSAIMMNDNQTIVGIHTRSVPGKNLNQGVRITPEILAQINTWMGKQEAVPQFHAVGE